MKKYRIDKIKGQKRIIALIDFGDVKKDDIGGVVSSEYNLSYYGNCWIYDDSKVTGYSRILDNVKICNNSEIRGCVCVEGDSIIDHSTITGSASVRNSTISNDSVIREHAVVYNSSVEHSVIRDNAYITNSSVENSAIGDMTVISNNMVEYK